MAIQGMGLAAQQVLVPLCIVSHWWDRGTVLHRPLQHLERGRERGMYTCPLVPQAVVLPRPLQHLDPPAPSGQSTRHLVLRAAVRFRPREACLTGASLSWARLDPEITEQLRCFSRPARLAK